MPCNKYGWLAIFGVPSSEIVHLGKTTLYSRYIRIENLSRFITISNKRCLEAEKKLLVGKIARQ